MNMFNRLSWGIWWSYDYFNQHFPICILEKLPNVYEWEVKVKTGFRKTTTNQAKLWTWKHVKHLKNCEWCKRDSSAIMKEDLLHNQSSDPSIHLKENVGCGPIQASFGRMETGKINGASWLFSYWRNPGFMFHKRFCLKGTRQRMIKVTLYPFLMSSYGSRDLHTHICIYVYILHPST